MVPRKHEGGFAASSQSPRNHSKIPPLELRAIDKVPQIDDGDGLPLLLSLRIPLSRRRSREQSERSPLVWRYGGSFRAGRPVGTLSWSGLRAAGSHRGREPGSSPSRHRSRWPSASGTPTESRRAVGLPSTLPAGCIFTAGRRHGACCVAS